MAFTRDNPVAKYYSRLGSRLGYKLVMKRSQYFGYYDATTKNESQAQINFHNKVGVMLELSPGMTILDAGCGQGVVACYLAQHYDVDIVGITVTPREVVSATKMAKKHNLSDKVRFEFADYSETGFANGVFDRIYTTETLSHAVDLEKVLREFMRLLKPGGKLVCVEYEFDFDKNQQVMKKIADFIYNYGAIFGVYQFSVGNFRRLLRKVGFSDVKEDDWTSKMLPSFRRLERLARPSNAIATILRIEHKMVNSVSAKFFVEGVANKAFFYKAYTARKSD